LAKCIPIIHVYGDLGNLGEFNQNEYSRLYYPLSQDPQMALDEIRIAIDRLRVIGERVGLDQNLADIHNILASAEVICFLGFGFDETNFDLLKIEELFTTAKPPPRIFGSTLGLELAEATRARTRCHGNIDDFSANYCERFLRHHGVLI
jgi:hypothetical protein